MWFNIILYFEKSFENLARSLQFLIKKINVNPEFNYDFTLPDILTLSLYLYIVEFIDK
jgi:hypothetical protein